MRKYTKEDFIKKSIDIYGEKYDYSEVDYRGNKIPVILILNGARYIQRPDSHLSGKCVEKEWKKNRGIEKFIKLSEKLHGKKYDYSKSIYLKGDEKIDIVCNEHGLFKQSPNLHLIGHGCPTCFESRGEKSIRIFLENNNIGFEKEFIFEGCKNKLPLPFDYYLIDYNLCIEYDGEQHFKPNEFFGGEKSMDKLVKNDTIKNQYCIDNNIDLIRIPYYEYNNIEKILYEKMNNYVKITQEEKNNKFIEKSRIIWGYKYNYDDVNYIDSKTPVIISYKNVKYNQSPSKHLQGKNCELNNNALSLNEFIRRSKETWGENRFNYSECEYTNTYSKIRLFDNQIGIWIEQKAFSHLSGNYPKLTCCNFINLSELIYDYKYDYSITIFKNICDKINIICPEHGEFLVRAYDHLNFRSGGCCYKCRDFDGEKEISKFLDKNKISYDRQHKFPDCKNIYQLPFDFYIPSIRTCIEFYSEQHYIQKAYESLKVNDKIKSDYCEENYIDLIRIRYDQFDDIYQILWNNLKS